MKAMLMMAASRAHPMMMGVAMPLITLVQDQKSTAQ